MWHEPCCKFTAEPNSEKKFKIGQHFSKLWTNIVWHVFNYALDLVIYALLSVIYAFDLVKHALYLVIYALYSVIYALDLVKRALDLVIYALDLIKRALNLINYVLDLVNYEEVYSPYMSTIKACTGVPMMYS